jgi:hypothetical protein
MRKKSSVSGCSFLATVHWRMKGVSASLPDAGDCDSRLFAGCATASVQSKLKGWLDPNAACCGLDFWGLMAKKERSIGRMASWLVPVACAQILNLCTLLLLSMQRDNTKAATANVVGADF